MRKVWLSTAAALFTAPLMGLPALAAPCTTDTVADYEALGSGGCTVGGVTFSNFSVTTIGSVTLGDFSVFNQGGEMGLTLNYTATTTGDGTSADVLWTYNVSGNLLTDALASVTGGASGTGTIDVNEQLEDSTTFATIATLDLNNITTSGSTTATFSPTAGLYVSKDQADYAGSSGSSQTSALTNAFSLTATPIPGALPLFATGLAGLWGLRRKRKTTGRLNSGAVIGS